MNTPEFRTRAYRASDMPDIEDFWVVSWRATGIEVDFEARRPWLRQHLTTMADSGVDIVVGLNASGRPAGFVTVDREGYLDQLCVAPEARGGGLARELLDEAKRRAPGGLRLKVNADNSRARRFYEREGFEATGHATSEMSGLAVVSMSWNPRTETPNI